MITGPTSTRLRAYGRARRFRTCDKCGWPDVSVLYRVAAVYGPPEEHFEVTCTRCSYCWIEPIDPSAGTVGRRQDATASHAHRPATDAGGDSHDPDGER